MSTLTFQNCSLLNENEELKNVLKQKQEQEQEIELFDFSSIENKTKEDLFKQISNFQFY